MRSLNVLAKAAALHMTPALEAALIDALRDARPEVAAGAARALGRHGSAAAEKALWARLEQWHVRWAGREDDLRYHVAEERSRNQHDKDLETELANAIARGKGWLCDLPKLLRLGGLLVTSLERDQIQSILHDWEASRISVTVLGNDGGDLSVFRVAQYDVGSLSAAREKMAQFPRGTVFAWSGDALFDELHAFALERGMKVVRL
jgi:hypothetical protein